MARALAMGFSSKGFSTLRLMRIIRIIRIVHIVKQATHGPRLYSDNRLRLQGIRFGTT
jgi:hypothetical protein